MISASAPIIEENEEAPKGIQGVEGMGWSELDQRQLLDLNRKRQERLHVHGLQDYQLNLWGTYFLDFSMYSRFLPTAAAS